MSDQRIDEVVRLKASGLSNRKIAAELGITKDAVFRLTKKAASQGKFEMPPAHSLKGVSALVDAEGNVIQQWIKTQEGRPDIASLIEVVKEALKDFDTRAPTVQKPKGTDEDLATVHIAADWHLGLLSWGKESGTDYDLEIAQRVIEEAVCRLFDNAPRSKQAVILGLGDLLHSDGYDPMTARSKNLLDVDGRWPKVLRVAAKLKARMINEALKKHESVLVRILPGNHDGESAIAISLALAMLYDNNPRVTVDTDPGYFWWWSWGNSFLGATHGDQAKMRDLPLVMATRNAEAWGKSKFRAIYTGHIHTQTGIELAGVTVESFQSPAAPDAWHSRMGYGAGRSLTAITHHKERGEIGRTRANIIQ